MGVSSIIYKEFMGVSSILYTEFIGVYSIFKKIFYGCVLNLIFIVLVLHCVGVIKQLDSIAPHFHFIIDNTVGGVIILFAAY